MNYSHEIMNNDWFYIRNIILYYKHAMKKPIQYPKACIINEFYGYGKTFTRHGIFSREPNH